LFFLSIYIWAIIQNKYFLIKHIRFKTRIFLNEYRKSSENLFQPLENEGYYEDVPVFDLFLNARSELLRIMEEERPIDLVDIETLSNRFAQVIAQWRIVLEEGVVQLATATTIAPFLGLLGTVWGVMNAFVGMGQMGNASISAVAPGLSEALVTTAVGLMVAIPSAIAFNYARNNSRTQVAVLNHFAMELLGNIENKFVTRESKR
jgi:biopolymer transport protein TolQ